MMNECDVVDLLTAFEQIGVTLWIGGGWGVDALVGYQTRPHNDLDIYTEKENADSIVNILTQKEYNEITTEYSTEGHKVWQDSSDRIVDLHLFEFEGTETLFFENESYPSNILAGEGTIGGIRVQCFTAEAQLLYHQGYEHNEKDVHDVMLLCKTFGLDIPTEYAKVAITDEIEA